jgi:hypothetical protein
MRNRFVVMLIAGALMAAGAAFGQTAQRRRHLWLLRPLRLYRPLPAT